MKKLSENVKDIKDTFDKNATADNTRAEKFGGALNNLAQLVQNFQGLVDAVQKSNDSDDSSEGPVQGIKETLEDLKNSFKTMEDKCISLAGMAGDTYDNENGPNKE